MKILLKILKWTSISIAGLMAFFAIACFAYFGYFYKLEMNTIKKDLNKIENVEVVNIWGQDDVTLEEVSVRLRIKDKGEIVLNGLSKDVFNYPKDIFVSEIGGYSFDNFSCEGGVGKNINIGTNSQLHHLFKKEFKTVSDVVVNYDFIFKTIESFQKSPKINHFETANSESYILVHDKKSTDNDPIYELKGVEDSFAYAEKLQWNKSNCYFGKR